MTPKSKKSLVSQVVLEHYLDNHRGMLTEEIAAKLDVSTSTVCRWWAKAIATPPGVRKIQDSRPHDWCGGTSRFWIYEPTETALREEILRLRAKLYEEVKR